MKRVLGRSGIEVSALGLGCWAIGGAVWRDQKPFGSAGTDDGESLRALHRALDLGINFFDTANSYGAGHSERLMGKAFEGRRDEVVIATKFGFSFDEEARTIGPERYDPESVRSDCEASLRRLRTNRIDLYQFHIKRCDPSMAVSLREVLEGLVDAGMIRSYGWSTNFPENAAIFAEGARCTAIQQSFSVFGGTEETLAFCEKRNLASILRGPLEKGLLSGKFSPDTTFPSDDIRHSWNMKDDSHSEQLRKMAAIRDVLSSGGRTAAQGALCWLWAKSPVMIPIPGFRTVVQVEENAGAMSFGPLSDAEMEEIDGLLGQERL
jgi:aryl-alcohol dehydrogenase-like predicted oxidoreductase